MKKLISFLCAAALTVSSFAGLAVTASAETPKSVTVAVDAGDTTANVTTTESSAVTGVLLLAKYSNNALTSLKVSPSFTTPANDVALGAAYADGDKLMAWEDLASMKPITVTRVAKPVPKTAVNTVAELAVTATNNSKAPATLTATVTAKQDAEFTGTATDFTFEWKKGNDTVANTNGATLDVTEAGTYTVTATYNGTGDYEGSLGPVSITIQAADDNRTNLSTAATVTVTPAGTVYTNTELTAAVTIPGAEEGDPATTVPAADLDYAWSKKGDSDAWTPVADATAATFTPTEAGTYKVTVTAKAASEDYVGTKDSAEVAVAKAPTVITPDATYVSFTKDGDVDNTGIDYRSTVAANDGKLKIGYVKIAGGNFAANNVKWDDQANVGLMSIDASTYVGKIKKATLKLGVNTEGDFNLNVRFAKVANYINIAGVTENAFIATGLSGLTGTIDSSNIVVVGQSTHAGTDIQCDITPLLRGAEDGKVTIGLFTDGGHSVFVNTYTVDVECADEDLTAAAVKVNQVYNNGTANVAIPTTAETADGTNWAAGDVYTTNMAETAANGTFGRKTFANVIDQKTGDPAAKYVYASGAANNQTLVAGDNTINLVYNQYKYATATFTAKVGEDAKAGVPIVISADEALTDGTTYTSKTVTSGADGTISEVLLPGTYKWTVATAGAYEGANGTFTVANDGAAVPVAVNLTGKSQTLTDITIDTTNLNTGILTTSQTSKNVGTISSTQVDETGTAMATQQAVTYSVTPADKGVSVSSAGVVTITNETPAGDYVIKATAGGVTTKDASAYTMTVAETGTETVKALTDDFEEATGVDSRVFGLDTTTDYKLEGRYTVGDHTRYAITSAGKNATNSISETLTNPVVVENGDTVTLSFDAVGGDTNKSEGTIIVASADDEANKPLVSITHGGSSWKCITSVKIAGEEKVSSDLSTNFFGFTPEKVKNYGAFSDTTAIGHVDITIDGNKNVTVTFSSIKNGTKTIYTSGTTECTFTGKANSASISSFTVTNVNSGADNILDRQVAVDNISTTITRTAAPTPAAKTITWANTLTGFTVKKGSSAIDSGATLAANDVITVEATAADKKVKSVTATGATFTVTDGVASATVGATPADIVITAVELEDKTPATQESALTLSIDAGEMKYIGNKTATDFGTFELAEDTATQGVDYKITGTSKYLTGYTDFSGISAEQEGNYIPLRAIIPADKVETVGSTAVVTWAIDRKAPTTGEVKTKTGGFTTEDPGLETVYFLGTDAKKITLTVDYDGDGTAYSKKTYVIDVSGVTKQSKTPATQESALTLNTNAGSMKYIGDKSEADFGTFTLTADTETEGVDYKITGTSKYLTGYTAFSSITDEQEGNYIPLRAIIPADKVETVGSTAVVTWAIDRKAPTAGEVKTKTGGFTTEDPGLETVYFLGTDAKKITLTVDYDGDGTEYSKKTYVIDISGVTKQAAPQASSATITKRTAATYDNEASVYGDVTYTAGANNTITAAGTLNYVKDVTDMGADLKDGYFLTTDVTLPEIADLDYTKTTVTVKSDKWTKGGIAPAGTFSSSKKAEDFITYIASDATKVEVTVDLDGDGELYTPTVYTITWDKVTNAAAADKLYFAPQAAPKYTAITTLTEANKATNGGYLAISPAEAEENGTVTITVHPEEGYQLKANSLKVMNGSTEVTATVNPSDSTTYTFTMPAGNVTVSAEFEAIYAVTFEAPTNGTLAVTKGETALTSGDTVATGSVITITATPTDKDTTNIYALSVNGTALTLDTEASEATADSGKYVVDASTGVVTAKVTVTSAETINAKFEKEFINYDFEDEGAGTAASFTEKSSHTAISVIDGSTVTSATGNTTKVVQFTNDANTGNDKGYGRIPFTSITAPEIVKVEFDSYTPTGSGRITYKIFDNAVRTNTYLTSLSKNTLSHYGCVFEQGQGNTNNDIFRVNWNSSYGLNADTVKAEWLHTEVTANSFTKKITFTIKKVSDGTVLTSGTLDFYNNREANYATGLEAFATIKDVSYYMDNIKVSAVEGTEKDVTVEFKNSNGDTLKDAVIEKAVVGTNYYPNPTDKNTFEPTIDELKHHCEYVSGYEPIEITDDGESKVTLTFSDEIYRTVTFTTTLDGNAKKLVPITITKNGDESFAAKTITTGDSGIATIALLPGTYSYNINDTPVYAGTSADNVIISNTDVPVNIALAAPTEGKTYSSSFDDVTAGTKVSGAGSITSGDFTWFSGKDDASSNLTIKQKDGTDNWLQLYASSNNQRLVAGANFLSTEDATNKVIALSFDYEATGSAATGSNVRTSMQLTAKDTNPTYYGDVGGQSVDMFNSLLSATNSEIYNIDIVIDNVSHIAYFISTNGTKTNTYIMTGLTAGTNMMCFQPGKGKTDYLDNFILKSVKSSQTLTAASLSSTTPTVGTEITVTPTATGSDGTYTYQWQSSADGTSWTNIANANTASLNTTSLSAGTKVRVVVKGSGDYAGVVISDVATLAAAE